MVRSNLPGVALWTTSAARTRTSLPSLSRVIKVTRRPTGRRRSH